MALNNNRMQLISVGKLKKYKCFYSDIFNSYDKSINKIKKINNINLSNYFIKENNLEFLCKKINNLKLIKKLIDLKVEYVCYNKNLSIELGIKCLKNFNYMRKIMNKNK